MLEKERAVPSISPKAFQINPEATVQEMLLHFKQGCVKSPNLEQANRFACLSVRYNVFDQG